MRFGYSLTLLAFHSKSKIKKNNNNPHTKNNTIKAIYLYRFKAKMSSALDA